MGFVVTDGRSILCACESFLQICERYPGQFTGPWATAHFRRSRGMPLHVAPATDEFVHQFNRRGGCVEWAVCGVSICTVEEYRLRPRSSPINYGYILVPDDELDSVLRDGIKPATSGWAVLNQNNWPGPSFDESMDGVWVYGEYSTLWLYEFQEEPLSDETQFLDQRLSACLIFGSFSSELGMDFSVSANAIPSHDVEVLHSGFRRRDREDQPNYSLRSIVAQKAAEVLLARGCSPREDLTGIDSSY